MQSAVKTYLLYILSLIIVALGQPAMVKLLCPLASGIGYGLCFLSLSSFQKKSRRLLAGFFWFFLVQLIHLSWMVSIKYQGIYIIFVYLLICLLLALQFLCIISVLFSKDSFFSYKLSFVAALACLLEWSRLYFFSGVGFTFAGISLSGYLISLQVASAFGVLGMSFFVWYANVCFYAAFKSQSNMGKILKFLAVALLPYVFGLTTLFVERVMPFKKQELNVVFVQTALSPSQKNYMRKFPSEYVSLRTQWESILQYILLIRQKNLDLIILPENSVPGGFRECFIPLEEAEKMIQYYVLRPERFFPKLCHPYAKKEGESWKVSNSFMFQTISNITEAELVTGLDDYDQIEKKHYNSAFCFMPHEENAARYEKQVLLPFAEAMPWRYFKRFAKYYGITDFFSPGHGPKVLSEKLHLGVNICVEETIPEVVRGFKSAGAQLLVNLTNDAWYPQTNLPAQHFFYGRIRAVENGLPLLRACNTGVTSQVDPLGRYEVMFQPETSFCLPGQGAVYKKIETFTIPTLYSLWGDSAIVVFSLLIIFYSIVLRTHRISL